MKAIIVSLWSEDVSIYLDELEELARTLGWDCVERVVQKREKIDSAYYIGKGKVEEIGELAKEKEAELIIIDAEISPIQRKNITEACGKEVYDRTDVILSIFSNNARTNEARMQVELASLKYKLPSIKGLGLKMSRLGGGVGTKGPGEKESEYQKRNIVDRIRRLERDIEKIRKSKNVHKQRREKTGTNLVSIIGYTNAGKSTLMNALTKAGVIEENKLFSTLDTKMKKMYSRRVENIILSDTVGFIRKLPHILVASFKSTLEEIKDAVFILEVVDVSKDNFEADIAVTKAVLEEIGVRDKKIIYVFNKCDKIDARDAMEERLRNKYGEIIMISALNNIGLSELVALIEDNILIKDSLSQKRIYIDGSDKIM